MTWPDELTTEQAAAYLSERGFTGRVGGPVPRRTVQKWCNDGDIPSRKFGRAVLIRRADLDRCLPTPGIVSRKLFAPAAAGADEPVITAAAASRLVNVSRERISYLVRHKILEEPLTASKVHAYFERPGRRPPPPRGKKGE